MPKTSKGDFVDFIEDAANNLGGLLQPWQNLFQKPGVNEGDIAKFFHDNHYYGVSLLDCSKLLRISQDFPDLVMEKY